MSRATTIGSLLVLSMLAPTSADAGDASQGQDKPVYVSSNSNSVGSYDEHGVLRVTTKIESGSVFKPRPPTTCSFVADVAGYTVGGVPFAKGQTVISERYTWVELEVFPTSEAPGPVGPLTVSKGSLGQARRLFGKFCEATHGAAYLGPVWVSARDPFLDPRPTARTLLNNLQLIRPEIYTNPVVDRWGGLVTRYPTWLAIQPDAWQPQRSNVAHHRGWTIYLHTTPRTMQFEINFTPDPNRPSPAFNGVVDCVNGPATADNISFPAMPTLPEQTEPGVNGPCMWTPPGPGTVTIQARITYTVTLWVSGYTEAMPDYTWTSPIATYTTGELTAVNTNQ